MADGLPKEGHGFLLPSPLFNKVVTVVAFFVGNLYLFINRSTIPNDVMVRTLLILNVLPIILWKLRLGYFTEDEFWDYWLGEEE